ncbi:MAG: hypothetical protein L7F77_09610 [Candidatus Magnetominusculus sp. LBB02]|nr:hypothetical protein [Candidatus Magnetominusculus sp. LBB02]
METIVKLEAPETDVPVDNSTLQDETIPVNEDSDETLSQQEDDQDAGVADTAAEYLGNITNALAADKEISAFSVENPTIYNAVKKMLEITVGELISTINDEIEDDDDNSDVVLPEVIVATPPAPALEPADETADAAKTDQVRGNDVAPAVKAVPVTAAEPAAQPDMKNIDRYAVPPRTASNSAKPVGGDDTFTASEIHNFYKDVVRGRYKGREKEADALERRIFNAVKEGRVTA